MSTTILSLWPQDLAPTAERTPLTILKEQAAQLGVATKNLLVGQVTTQSHLDGNEPYFNHWFNIVAPALDRYAYQLLTVSHRMDLYPLTINFHATKPPTLTKVTSEAEFVAYLQQVFASAETRRIIGALLAQVQS